MYTLLLGLIYLAFISLGLPDSLLGAGWPIMRLEFDVPISYMGIVSMVISGGTICSSLASERLTKKFGTKIVTVSSVFLTAVALFGFSTVTQFWMLCVWAIPYGFGAGAIDAALNNYVAVHYNSRHMSWLHCFWGVGTIISPYIMSYALAHSVWSQGYRMVSFIQIGIALVLLLTLPVWKVNENKTKAGKVTTRDNTESTSQDSKKSMPVEQKVAKDKVKDVTGEPISEGEERILGIKGALRIKGVPYLLLGFFAYCAAESTAMLWISSFLVETRGVTENLAAAFAALFFIGMTVGRFLSGLISDKLGDRNMIRLGAVIAFVGVLGIFLPVETTYVSLVGFLVIGLGCAPVYPSIIHSTPSNFGAENSQAIIGIQMASAYVGSTFMPPLFGLLANHISIKLMPFFLLFFFVLMIVMTERTFKMVNDIKKRQ